jgi:hypothetical protein
LWGYGVQFTFRAIKLLDYRADLAQLEDSRNPFTTIVLAHLQAQETRESPPTRLAAKLALLRRLYGLGYNREQIVGLFRFVDWVMALPPELAQRFWAELQTIEEEHKVPYITSVERIGREAGLKEGLEKGRQEGLQEGREEGHQQGMREGLLDGIELALELKFGEAGRAIIPEIRRIDDLTVIRAIYREIPPARTLDDVRRVYA